ncbi:uncharacterized protein LOC130654167 isoform X1 [Hydractinia symbiolongicarpus]|uniref:uncharacterized protein LOC130654167 isoform X1 n=1 Tax=Hydractinia symbiolongicarpus TaxID=13093 RepID=UPI00254DFD06|nr:uncharacterized protein LOC130654167 isoform X1 [Hydractinia symbiolongicarpus]
MTDIDIDTFEDHGRPDETTDETFPLIPTGDRTGVQIHTSGEKETSFGGLSLNTRVLKEIVEGLYDRLTEKLQQNPEGLHTDLFEIRDGELYYKGRNEPLTTNNERLRSTGTIAEILGKKRLRNLGFDIPENNLSTREAIKLNKIQEELPSSSRITNATDIELDTIIENISDSTEDLVHQSSIDHETTRTDDLFEYPVRELLGLDKALRNIRGSLQSEVAKKVQLEQHIDREKNKLEEMANDTTYTDEQREEVKDRMKRINDGLKTRQESIDILKGKLNSQVTSIRETIAKVLNKDTTLGEKIRTLFREQGITIVSILTAFGMAIGVLVEALLPGAGGSTSHSQNPDKGDDKKDGAKEWIKNKLEALGSLPGRLAGKAAAALPGILGSIVSWILNRAKEVVGWLSQNLWALVVGIGGLIYTYLMTKR